MKRTAGALALLAALGGCANPRVVEGKGQRGTAAPPVIGQARPNAGPGRMAPPGPTSAGAMANMPPPVPPGLDLDMAAPPPPLGIPDRPLARPATASELRVPPGPGSIASTPPVPPPPPPSTPPAPETRTALSPTSFNPRGGEPPRAAEPPRATEPASKPAVPHISIVNSKRIVLNYEIREPGVASVNGVELWYTQDGRTWQRCEAPAQKRSPYIIEVNDEGLYGFIMLPAAEGGLASRAPQAGDLPQVWVDVDLTKPVVRLTNVEPGSGPDARSLVISWSANDSNLGQRPVTLYYAEQPNGPWTAFAVNIRNRGRYVWPLPNNVPARAFIRIEALDLAGNSTIAQTSAPLILDTAAPAAQVSSKIVRILAVESVEE